MTVAVPLPTGELTLMVAPRDVLLAPADPRYATALAGLHEMEGELDGQRSLLNENRS